MGYPSESGTREWLVISGMEGFYHWLSYYYLPYVKTGYQRNGGLLTTGLVSTICRIHNCSLNTFKLYKGSVATDTYTFHTIVIPHRWSIGWIRLVSPLLKTGYSGVQNSNKYPISWLIYLSRIHCSLNFAITWLHFEEILVSIMCVCSLLQFFEYHYLLDSFIDSFRRFRTSAILTLVTKHGGELEGYFKIYYRHIFSMVNGYL